MSRDPPFVPTNDLETVMLEAMTGGDSPERVYDALANSVVLVPLRAASREDPQGELQFIVTEVGARRGVAVFTSAAQLRKAASNIDRCARLTGAALARGWNDRSVDVLLNPGGDLGLVVPAAVVRTLPKRVQHS